MKTLNRYISATERISSIDDYINEKLIIGNNLDNEYKYYPKTRDELIDCINEKIEKEGYGTKNNPLDLNDIDTSEITDMSNLFDPFDGKLMELSENGNFDISNWDVSNIKNMYAMFWGSGFDGDISNWDVSNVEDMSGTFYGSDFNGDISEWDVSNVKSMRYMFYESKFNGNINKWHISNVEDMDYMFNKCPLELNPPKWYK